MRLPKILPGLVVIVMVIGMVAGAPVDDAVNAAKQGDESWLLDWIGKGGDPNQEDENGWTPLLIASARGRAAVVDLLLNNGIKKADPGKRFGPTGALPIHLAGQSGDVETVKILLKARPGDINEAWLLNGHTVLLQAAFYGHLDLAQYLISNGANTSATTLRGLTALDFAKQFDNKPLIDILSQVAPTEASKASYNRLLMDRIREPATPGEEDAQHKVDVAAVAMADAFQKVSESPDKLDFYLKKVESKLEGADINRLAGDLRQPLLVIAVTGNNTGPNPEALAAFRLQLVKLLLDRGAKPLLREKHPMGAHAVIRASVFGHLDILKLIGSRLTAKELNGALNEIPQVNGLTALHDAVLRAGTASPERYPGYLEQIRWEVAAGARSDIEDYAGRTQHRYAESISDPKRSKEVIAALDAVPPAPQWNHPAIVVPSLDAARQWYTEMFGFLPLSEPIVQTPASGEKWKLANAIFGEGLSEVRYVRMRQPDAPNKQALELFELKPATAATGKRRSGYAHVCMILGDPETTANRIAAHGGKFLYKTDLNGLTIIFCEDPYGNIIELASAPW